ncbi:MAG: hypothetical protein QF438_03715, partial [Phycisphaerales bacterium]|nr:hypothetical protein [Phycisphaerales bacterium]
MHVSILATSCPTRRYIARRVNGRIDTRNDLAAVATEEEADAGRVEDAASQPRRDVAALLIVAELLD